VSDGPAKPGSAARRPSLLLSERASRLQRLGSLVGHGILLTITSASTLAVLFIFIFIIKDTIPFFFAEGFDLGDVWPRTREFFTGTAWYPVEHEGNPPTYGAVPIFFGSAMVTLGAIVLAVPLGVSAAICLSDVVPFKVRQLVKPVIEILAAIPSVAYGFFALVVFATWLQNEGGTILAVAAWMILGPLVVLGAVILGDLATTAMSDRARGPVRLVLMLALGALGIYGLAALSGRLAEVEISSGTNALNVSVILGIMALPTVVSVSEDALQAVGRELREGSYALGATRAETLVRVVIPAASSGICAAVILGVMRAVGETMVVLMASGNSAQIPEPWYNFLEPVATLTATIAGDMGEADHTTGSARYHVLFAMALCLLVFSFICNLLSEWAVRRTRKKLAGG
jgi:phosphate transport system permease protein